jgi:hypothetical protein
VLFAWEKTYLSRIEEDSFGTYTEKVKVLQAMSGVEISKVDDVRSELSALISKMWECVSRHGAVLTSREKALAAVVKDNSIGNMKATRENFALALQTLQRLRLVGEDITNLARRLKLTSLLRELTEDPAEKLIVDSSRVLSMYNTLWLTVPVAAVSDELRGLLQNLATAIGANLSIGVERTRNLEEERTNRFEYLEHEGDYDEGENPRRQPTT